MTYVLVNLGCHNKIMYIRWLRLAWWLSGKESACSAGDPGSIPGLGRSPGGRHDNPLQYSCLENPMDRWAWWTIIHVSPRVGHDLATIQQYTCLVAQMLNNLPAVQETQVQSLGWEDSLKKGMATLAWRIPWTEEPGRLQSIGSHRVGHDWSN